MKFYNLKQHNEQVSFIQAVENGLGSHQGLFFPVKLPKFELSEIEVMLKMDFITRSSKILAAYIGDEISTNKVTDILKEAFSFPIILQDLTKEISCLELFHGPTLAFKDFGARFMAQILYHINKNKQITILIATSGDTGAAVAHAFYGIENIKVVILYPQGKITHFQEKLFCTLNNNIKTIAIQGDFDACQALIKQAFDDTILQKKLNLNSANSINVSRLLAQVCYYFEGVAQAKNKISNRLIIAVPSGNFGNLTAGLLAKSLGLPVNFIFSTNANDTVPRFLDTGKWLPKNTISTLSNAMDISQPNNWVRIEELFRRKNWNLKNLNYTVVSDDITRNTMINMSEIGYISDPHSATAYYALQQHLKKDEYGLFIGTAHPVKFQEIVTSLLNKTIPIPQFLNERLSLPISSHEMPAKFNYLKEFLLRDN